MCSTVQCLPLRKELTICVKIKVDGSTDLFTNKSAKDKTHKLKDSSTLPFTAKQRTTT